MQRAFAIYGISIFNRNEQTFAMSNIFFFTFQNICKLTLMQASNFTLEKIVKYFLIQAIA